MPYGTGRPRARALASAVLLAHAACCLAEDLQDQTAPKRLRVINGCSNSAIWIAHSTDGARTGNPQNKRLEPLQSFDFSTPSGSAFRYWPKMNCNEHGGACGLGESGGLEGRCDADVGCAPPVDTKLEATFGPEGGKDLVDVSLTDGFTLPFKLELKGGCVAPAGAGRSTRVVDCSRLLLDSCPVREGTADGGSMNLTVVHPSTGQRAGCHSPCSRLTAEQWRLSGDEVVPFQSSQAAPFCCPIATTSAEACRAGPASRSRYVNAVHQMCPGPFAYAYDGGLSIMTCPADTRYEMTFYCPYAPEESADAAGKEGAPSQRESMSGAVAIRSAPWGGECLQPSEEDLVNGRRSLRLSACTGTVEQSWRVDRDAGTIRWAKGPTLCLDAEGQTWLAPCSKDSRSQQFLLPPGLGRGKIRWGGDCLGAAGAGVPAAFLGCGEESGQEFTFGDSPIDEEPSSEEPADGEAYEAAHLRFLEQPMPDSDDAVAARETTRRLTITNGCESEVMWIAHSAGGGLGSGPDPQNVAIPPGGAFDFATPRDVMGLRYWPKLRCNEDGDMCELGDSHGPGARCSDDVVDCSPPVDTKFDALFFDKEGEDVVGMNLMNGFTLAFKFQVDGTCKIEDGWQTSQTEADCSTLSLEHCPSSEGMGAAGTHSLRVTHPVTNHPIGCFSPCGYLLSEGGLSTNVTEPMCCHKRSAEECRTGPMGKTSYAAAVHQMCPGVRAFAHDGGIGLLKCPADTRYRLTFFCPKDFDQRPVQPHVLAEEDSWREATSWRRLDGLPTQLAGIAGLFAVAMAVSLAGAAWRQSHRTVQANPVERSPRTYRQLSSVWPTAF